MLTKQCVKRIIIGICGLIIIGLLLLGGAGYYYLKVFMNRAPLVIHGHDISTLARGYRESLIKTYHGHPISFKSADGVTLSGIFFERSHAQYNLVACHGYRGMKESFRDFIALFPKANILIFDFRAHGESEGNTITFGYNEAYDVAAAVHTIKQLTAKNSLPLVLLGTSMGGVAALKAVSSEQRLCDALIIDSSYATFENMTRRVAKRLISSPSRSNALRFNHDVNPLIPVWLGKPFAALVSRILDWMAHVPLRSLNLVEYVKKINVPLLIIHSSGDETIPAKNAEAIYEAACLAGKRAQLWIAPPARHSFLHKNYPDLYKEKVDAFIHQYCQRV